MPFQAVALRRRGRADEAIALLERATTDLPPDAGLLIASAIRRTYTLLLAGRGSADAEAGPQ